MTNASLKASVLTTLANAKETYGAALDRRGTSAHREDLLMTMHVLQGIHWELSHRDAEPFGDMIALGQKVWKRAIDEPFMRGIQKDWHDRAFLNLHHEMMDHEAESILLQSL